MRKSALAAGDRIQFAMTASLLVASVALGGGQGGLGDTGLQLLALALLGYLFARWATARRELISWRTPAWLPLIFLAVPLVQLLPIPLSAWSSVEPRADIASQLAVVGLRPDPHFALQSLASERALWTLLPGVALYLSTLTLPAERQLQLVGAFLLMALLGLILGLIQLADGPDSVLRFYANTNPSEAVGFFANRNHLAALLLMALPLSLAATAFAIGERIGGKPIGPLMIVGAIGLSVLLILGIALTRSRAGLLFGMFGLLLSVPMMLSLRRRRGMKRVFGIIVSVALLLTVQFALYGILQRLQADPLGDYRWQIAQITAEAAQQNAPLGSGLGSFRQVFQVLDTTAPGDAIVNHTHNDYLELWLEAGWIFIVLAVLFIGLLLWAGISAWRSSDGRDSLWAKAAWISLLLVLLHSVVDYPLRTSSNQAVFAVLLAVLLSWRWPPADIASQRINIEKGTP